MKIVDDRGYRDVLRAFEKLWDAELSDAERARLSEAIQAAELYEAAQPPTHRDSLDTSAPSSRGDQIDDDMVKDLSVPITYRAFVTWRSAIVALRACSVLMCGDTAATKSWMNRNLVGIGQTPIDLAEEGDCGLQMALDEIGRIDAGIFA